MFDMLSDVPDIIWELVLSRSSCSLSQCSTCEGEQGGDQQVCHCESSADTHGHVSDHSDTNRNTDVHTSEVSAAAGKTATTDTAAPAAQPIHNNVMQQINICMMR